MLAMHVYRVIVSNKASSDLDAMAEYIASVYRPESGHNYVDRVLGQLAALSYTANVYPFSRLTTAKRIHLQAKTLSIVNHRWTDILHIDGDFVVVDRIIPSKMMVD